MENLRSSYRRAYLRGSPRAPSLTVLLVQNARIDACFLRKRPKPEGVAVCSPPGFPNFAKAVVITRQCEILYRQTEGRVSKLYRR